MAWDSHFDISWFLIHILVFYSHFFKILFEKCLNTHFFAWHLKKKKSAWTVLSCTCFVQYCTYVAANDILILIGVIYDPWLNTFCMNYLGIIVICMFSYWFIFFCTIVYLNSKTQHKHVYLQCFTFNISTFYFHASNFWKQSFNYDALKHRFLNFFLILNTFAPYAFFKFSSSIEYWAYITNRHFLFWWHFVYQSLVNHFGCFSLL